MKISAREIREASRCLRYYKLALSKDVVCLPKRELQIIDEVIRKSYVQATETRFKPAWRTIIGWVDKRVFKHVDIDDEDSFQAGKTQAEHILKFLRRWYNEILLPEHVLAYPSLTISRSVGNSVVWGEIPIIKAMDTPVILSVDTVASSFWWLYNNIEVRTQAWLVANELGVKNIGYQRISPGPVGGYNHCYVGFVEDDLKVAGKMIHQIVNLIERGVDFPSITSGCNECVFRKRCKI